MNTEFKPGQYIVTQEGLRGYVIEKLDYCADSYEVRLAGGYAIRAGKELQIDEIAENSIG